MIGIACGVSRGGRRAELLRALGGMSPEIVLTDLVPAPDAASRYLIHARSEQPVSLVGPPGWTASPKACSP